MSARNWCWTLNNHWQYDPLDPESWPHHRYTVFQEEIGETGNPHLQGYSEFNSPMKFVTMTQLIPGAAFFKRNGPKAKARAYCMKADTRISDPEEFGEWSTHQGERSDLDEACDDIKAGKTRYELAQDHSSTFVRYYKGLDELRLAVLPPTFTPEHSLEEFRLQPLELTQSQLIFGASAIGKTQFALAHFRNPLICRHVDDLRSFVPSAHDGLVFDDMCFLHLPVESRIHLVDMDLPCPVHLRYNNVIIPPRTPRIFTHNTGDVFDMQGSERHQISQPQLRAIRRRLNMSGPFEESLWRHPRQ